MKKKLSSTKKEPKIGDIKKIIILCDYIFAVYIKYLLCSIKIIVDLFSCLFTMLQI